MHVCVSVSKCIAEFFKCPWLESRTGFPECELLRLGICLGYHLVGEGVKNPFQELLLFVY